MKFSIIVPVYNTQKYLTKCVESILNQKEAELELILVDDGSSDGSSLLCDEFSEKDTRVKVIHQGNEGVSVARNRGLKEATGDYILFVDADDFLIFDNALSKIKQLLLENKSDLLIFNFQEYIDGGLISKTGTYDREKIIQKNIDEAVKELIFDGKVTHLVWDKVIKRKIIVENELEFLNVERLEDSEFFGRIMQYISSVDYCDEKIYAYRKREGSMTTEVITASKIESYHKVFQQVDLTQGNYQNPEARDNFLAYSAYPYLAALGISELFYSKHNIAAKDRLLREYSYLLKYSNDPRVKKVSLCYKFFGKKLTYFLLKMAAKHRKFIVE